MTDKKEIAIEIYEKDGRCWDIDCECVDCPLDETCRGDASDITKKLSERWLLENTDYFDTKDRIEDNGEFYKVIDRKYELFEYFSEKHDLVLNKSQIDDIVDIVKSLENE